MGPSRMSDPCQEGCYINRLLKNETIKESLMYYHIGMIQQTFLYTALELFGNVSISQVLVEL